MSILKYVAITVLGIVLLAILKPAFAFLFPNAGPFIKNLLSCLQLFLLGAVFFWLLILIPIKVIGKKRISFGKSLLLYTGLFILLEIGCTLLLHNAGIVSRDIHRYLVEYYMDYERKIPERSRECGCHDSTLIYTYRPNAECLQHNFEFSDSIYINEAGLRDDNASLTAPDIICLGDSYTMGWGVGQEESFPELLEKRTGFKVLNAGISSYGTARETMLLNRLDTSKLKVLIIQYSFNDIAENTAYIKNNYTLPVPDSGEYESLVNYHKWRTLYFPLKRSLNLTKIIVKDLSRQLRNRKYLPVMWDQFYDTSYVKDAAKSFLDILYHSGINFQKIKVLVIDINRYPVFDHHFLETAAITINSAGYADNFIKSVRFITTPELNKPEYFFPLDNHLTSAGHAALAEQLLPLIRSLL